MIIIIVINTNMSNDDYNFIYNFIYWKKCFKQHFDCNNYSKNVFVFLWMTYFMNHFSLRSSNNWFLLTTVNLSLTGNYGNAPSYSLSFRHRKVSILSPEILVGVFYRYLPRERWLCKLSSPVTGIQMIRALTSTNNIHFRWMTNQVAWLLI